MWHVLAAVDEDNAHFCYHHQHVLIRRTDGMISNSPGMNPRFEYLIYRYYHHSQARNSSGKYNQRGGGSCMSLLQDSISKTFIQENLYFRQQKILDYVPNQSHGLVNMTFKTHIRFSAYVKKLRQLPFL